MNQAPKHILSSLIVAGALVPCLFADPVAVPLFALWPTLAALLAVFGTRRAGFGLMVGALAGSWLAFGAAGHGLPRWVGGSVGLFEQHLIPALQSRWNVSVILFTLMVSGFVAVLEAGGGFRVVLERLLRRRRDLEPDTKALWATYLSGLVCFFDGLANSMLVGRSLKPLTDRAGVPRAKLAYVVDSTGAAVCCVALISTWIAYQLSMIEQGLSQIGASGNPYLIFLRSIPLNFYCWYTLILVAFVIGTRWDIGPMRAAVAEPAADEAPAETLGPPMDRPRARFWIGLCLPFTVLLVGLFAGLYRSGGGALTSISLQSVAEAFGNARTDLVLVVATALASLVAVAANKAFVCGREIASVYADGVLRMMPAIWVLLAAWTLSSTLKELEAAVVLTNLLQGDFPAFLFPSLVFLVGTLIAFSTGTSWGTMGILMPLALPVALGLSVGVEDTLVAATVAAVFSAAVFGDHCSPFSDTTIVSAASCGTDTLTHVKTQLPYALIAAALALWIGFLPIGLGIPAWLSLAGGLLLIWGLTRWRGARA